MKSPRDLYGRQLADHLIRHWKYVERSQEGSHIQLRTEEPSGQTLPIPAHKPLRTGTLNAILKMVSDHKGVSKQDILKRL